MKRRFKDVNFAALLNLTGNMSKLLILLAAVCGLAFAQPNAYGGGGGFCETPQGQRLFLGQSSVGWDRCTVLHCQHDGLTIQSCGDDPQVNPNCFVKPGDNNQPFPHCCAKTYCYSQGLPGNMQPPSQQLPSNYYYGTI